MTYAFAGQSLSSWGPTMSGDLSNPMELQRAIISFVCEQQVGRDAVTASDVAQAFNVDVTTVHVHIEMLVAEGRLGIIRDEVESRLFITEEQRARHEAPPPHVAAQRQLERFGTFVETIHEQMNRILSWAPLALALAGCALGWFATGPAMRQETTFFVGLFGLTIGLIIRKEMVR